VTLSPRAPRGRGWTTAGAFTSRGGPGEGVGKYVAEFTKRRTKQGSSDSRVEHSFPLLETLRPVLREEPQSLKDTNSALPGFCEFHFPISRPSVRAVQRFKGPGEPIPSTGDATTHSMVRYIL
jgi:hypothetical protein